MTAELEWSFPGRPGSAAARAYAYAKQRLLDGRFAPGTLLSENELARELSISRTPVREAFLALEAEELIQLYPRRGALVRPITASEAEDVLEARLLIESHCVRRVTSRGALPAGALEQSLAEQEGGLRGGGPPFAVSDRRFHRIIVRANGNEVLTRQYDALRDRQQRIAANAAARDPRRIAAFIAEHREIAAAIAGGDADAAAAVMATHLRRAHELARRPPP